MWLFDNHSMAARPIFVKVAMAQSHQHNLEPRPALGAEVLSSGLRPLGGAQRSLGTAWCRAMEAATTPP